jgi:hypothetical protein
MAHPVSRSIAANSRQQPDFRRGIAELRARFAAWPRT